MTAEPRLRNLRNKQRCLLGGGSVSEAVERAIRLEKPLNGDFCTCICAISVGHGPLATNHNPPDNSPGGDIFPGVTTTISDLPGRDNFRRYTKWDWQGAGWLPWATGVLEGPGAGEGIDAVKIDARRRGCTRGRGGGLITKRSTQRTPPQIKYPPPTKLQSTQLTHNPGAIPRSPREGTSPPNNNKKHQKPENKYDPPTNPVTHWIRAGLEQKKIQLML